MNISSFDGSCAFFFSKVVPRLEQILVSCFSGGIEYVTKNVGGINEVGFERIVRFGKCLGVDELVLATLD